MAPEPDSAPAAAGSISLQQPGRDLYLALYGAYRRAVRSRLAVVGTDLVLCYAVIPTRPVWHRLPGHLDRAWRPVRRGTAGLTDPPPPPSTRSSPGFDAEVAFLATAALREAAWDGAQPLRLRRRGKHRIRLPAFSDAVRHAVHESIHEAGRRGVARAGAPHLLVAVLSVPGGAASRLLETWRVPAYTSLIPWLRADPSFARAAPARTRALVAALELYGELPVPTENRRQWPLRAAARAIRALFLRRPYRRYGAGYGHPIPSLVELAARDHAVRLGRPSSTSAEVLLGIVDLHEALDADGRAIPAEVARYNQAGEILPAHGLTLAGLTRAAGRLALTPADAEDRIDDVPRRGWHDRRSKPGQPTQGRTALLALRSASHAAHRAGHPITGTTHLLVACLAEPCGPAARLLALAGVDPERIRSEATEWLGRLPDLRLPGAAGS